MRMNLKFYSVILIICVLLVSCTNKNNSQMDSSEIKGPYLGMKPPGDLPELFAPGIVSSIFWEHSGAVFSPDGKELFWTRAINEGRTPRIVITLHMKQINGVWTQPELAPFNKTTYTHINSISPDGKRLYYYASEGEKEERMWVIDKTEDGWGEPRLLKLNDGDEGGIKANEVHETRSGNLYFDCSIDNKYGIARSKWVDGRYQKVETLGPNINLPTSDKYSEFNSAIDPDEDFIVFASRRPGGYSGQNLYISFRQDDDTWGPAINLGSKINKPGAWMSWPQLSPDGKYLFLTSRIKPFTAKDIEENKYSYAELEKFQKSIINGWGNIYWVNTSFVEKLRPAKLKNFKKEKK